MANKICDGIEKCAQVGSYLSGLFILLIVMLISVEIVARLALNTSTQVSEEYTGYFMAAVVALGIGYAFKEGAHIRIEMLRSVLRPAPRRLLDQAMACVAVVLTSYAGYHSVRMVIDAYVRGIKADTISETPVFIPQLVIPIGLTVFALQVSATLLRRPK